MSAKKTHSQEQYEACAKYVDDQIAIMTKFNSAPRNWTPERREQLIQDVLKHLPDTSLGGRTPKAASGDQGE